MENPEDPGRAGRGGPLWLHPDDDLAPNRPGETLHGKVAALPSGALRRVTDRVLRRSGEADALRAALLAEEAIGVRLDALAGDGWRVLHSIPLPGEADLPHLAIGPGGVLSLRSVRHAGARVSVGEDVALIDGRRQEPYVRRCRRDGRRAAHALSRGCGFPVAVRPVLVVVAARGMAVTSALRDVEVLREHQLAGLARRGGVLKPDSVEAIYGVARDRRTWRAA
ncbi:NERD domain-containing protein [Streptomyces litchfieldiae]|uniref:NERD domain-containing protein n=1 Tax=Streptomyces litchfieldiae TaxID=3075543 RepID=A0ABU2N0D6_9ACTN|nr:NERD domain-containing protein [Streptomyces sp. DSM 44938]MDT0347360.1 NERD domain-containing protein [Streptomyces sp. DSM 44938]